MASEDKPKRGYINQNQRKSLMAAAVGIFMRRYGRKARKSGDPNDRSYDRDMQGKIKRMSPQQLDRLLRDDNE